MPREGRTISKLALARLLLAAVALGLMVLPGEVWSQPSSDLEQNGFDPELHYAQPVNRHLFDPFLILENGTWEACPCLPGSQLTIAGQGLADKVSRDSGGVPELAGTQVLVDGRPAAVFLATPSQVNFALPEEAEPPAATVTLLTDGQIRGQDTVGVQAGPPGQLPPGEELVEISTDKLRLMAPAGREPTVHLITTPLSFRASFSASIEEQTGGAVPLRVMVWNPRNFSSFDLVFGADGEVQAAFIESRGRIARLYKLGTYAGGVSYEVTVEWRRGEEATVAIAGPGGERSASLSSEDAPALFDAYRPSLTVVSTGHDGLGSAALTDYRLSLLPGRFTTIRVDDAKIPPVMVAVAVAGGALLLLPLARLRLPVIGSTVRSAGRRWRQRLAGFGGRRLLGLGALGASFLGLNAVLFTLGGHPFDMGAQKIWAYAAVQYGMTDLYYVAQTATLADVWNGTPYHEAVFPYNLGMAYYFWSIGNVHLLLFGHASPDSMSLEVTIKAFNLAFMIADAVLVYAILRTLRPSASLLPWVGSGLLLFGPAFVFDTAVWGETESVPLFFLLASLLAALKDRPTLAWSLLAGAFLTKQTVLLAVLMIGVYYLLRFPWRRNLGGVSTAVMLASIASLPFTLNGYPPSVTLDPTLSILWIHGGTGAEKVFQVVSFDAFNVWTLVTGLRDGVHGLGRFQFPDHIPALAGFSYHEIGSGLLAMSMLGLLLWLLFHRREAQGTRLSIFMLVALVFLAELILPTRPVSRYFVFPMVFSLFGLAGRGRWLAASAFAALSLTTFVSSYGSMASALEDFPYHAPLLAPDNNPVSAAMLQLFRSDVIITLAASLNLLSLAGVAAALWWEASGLAAAETQRPESPKPHPRPIPTPLVAGTAHRERA